MKALASFVAAILLGAAAGELLCHWPAFRDFAGRVTDRGGLVTIVNGKGLYESDLGGNDGLSAHDLITGEKLQELAAAERPHDDRIFREHQLIRAQFGDDRAFDAALRASFPIWSLHEMITNQLRSWQWLEKQVAPALSVTEEECRQYYDAHPEMFALPVRYRAAHIFVAAHGETPPEVVAEKEKAIAELGERLRQGEPLADLAAEASEDEATKNRGGDLGYFAETRVPAEFVAEIQKLRVGEISPAFRSHLGFHIVQLTEIKSAGFLSFEEARAEIAAAIANERRANTVDRIAREISAFASR